MTTRKIRRFTFTQSLKGKFFIAALAMALLTISAGVVAIYALNASSTDNRLLAEKHMLVMQDAQKLRDSSLMIGRLVISMINGDGSEVYESYNKILEQLDLLDTLVSHLGNSTTGPAILDLHQVNQVFRNSVHIIVRLRNEALNPDISAEKLNSLQQRLNKFQEDLNQQIHTMIITNNELSSRINFDYRQEVDQLIAKTEWRQNLVMSFIFAVLILILIDALYFRNSTLRRLQKISFYMRQQTDGTIPIIIPVQGEDEIGNMARALEKLLEDHRLLARNQKKDDD